MPRPRRLHRLACFPLLLLCGATAPLSAQPALAGPEIELAPPGPRALPSALRLSGSGAVAALRDRTINPLLAGFAPIEEAS